MDKGAETLSNCVSNSNGHLAPYTENYTINRNVFTEAAGGDAFQVVGLQLQSKTHEGDFRYSDTAWKFAGSREFVSKGTLKFGISLLSITGSASKGYSSFLRSQRLVCRDMR